MGWLLSFYRSSIGKKITVAVTGAIMILFLLVHMLGNLQIFEGPGATPATTRINQYAELLRLEPVLLWAFRVVILSAAILHVVTILQLQFRNWAARGSVGYKMKKTLAADFASRTMFWGGLIIFTFIVLHILHFTTGTVFTQFKPSGEERDVYSYVVSSFRNPWLAGGYFFVMVVIFFHLQHGITSAFETLGSSHPRYWAMARVGGPILALLITAGFALVPLLVFFHAVGLPAGR